MTNVLGKSGNHAVSWSSLIIAVTMAAALWVSSAPISVAQTSPAQMVESNLPHGKTIVNASKANLLAAISATMKKNPKSAAQIAEAIAMARPDSAKDILRTAFVALGSRDCDLLGQVYRAMVEGVPNQASGLANVAVQVAPDCAPSFVLPSLGQAGAGTFEHGVANQNPVPATIAGGGGQGTVVAVCYNGVTQFFSPADAQAFIASHPGATIGACVVTPITNR